MTGPQSVASSPTVGSRTALRQEAEGARVSAEYGVLTLHTETQSAYSITERSALDCLVRH